MTSAQLLTIAAVWIALVGAPGNAKPGAESPPAGATAGTESGVAGNAPPTQSAAVAAAAVPLPVFVPPSSGRPLVRLRSASARGSEIPRPVVSVLAPERVGLTVAAQPALYWHLDRVPRDEAVAVFALTQDDRDDPVAEFSIPMPDTPGVHRVVLADHDVRLEPGVEYEWSVALVADPDKWSQNVFAIGGIQRVSAPAPLEERLRGAEEPAENVYASLGFWYDAFAAAEGERERDALLRQVGLGDLKPAP